VDNLGEPVAYLVLPRDLPVHDPSGAQIGHVAQVLADEAADIFHGLLISLPGVPDRHRFADRTQIAGLYERGVTLAVPADQLHEPSEDAVAAAAAANASFGEGLRRAWERLNRPI
jgi:uncharacterized protein YrrD